MSNLFDIEKFNIIDDKENYYFFRALNMADNQDLDNATILDEEGNFDRIRTDRERYEEREQSEKAKYNKDDKISLEQVYDHIKMHYRQIVYHFQAMLMSLFLMEEEIIKIDI